MAEIENGYYYIEDGVVLKEDGYTDSVDKVGKVVGFDYEQEIRNKAIEEFAEQLKNKLVLRYGSATPTEQYVAMQVDEWCNEIAESMKKGGK